MEQYFLLASLPLKYRKQIQEHFERNLDLIEKYQSKVHQVTFKNYYKMTNRALWGDDINIYNAILNLEGSFRLEDEHKLELLHYIAIKSVTPDVIEYALKGGADINQRANKGFTPLHAAVTVAASSEVINALIDNGAEIDAKDYKKGYSALYYAVKKNLPFRIVELLINRGTDVNTVDNDGVPLIVMAINNEVENKVLNLLFKNGVDKEKYKTAFLRKH